MGARPILGRGLLVEYERPGAGRGRLLTLIVLDGLRLTGVGVIAGLAGAAVLGIAVSRLFFGVTPADPAVVAVVVTVLVAVSVLACLLPARRAMRVDPVMALRCE